MKSIRFAIQKLIRKIDRRRKLKAIARAYTEMQKKYRMELLTVKKRESHKGIPKTILLEVREDDQFLFKGNEFLLMVGVRLVYRAIVPGGIGRVKAIAEITKVIWELYKEWGDFTIMLWLSDVDVVEMRETAREIISNLRDMKVPLEHIRIVCGRGFVVYT